MRPRWTALLALSVLIAGPSCRAEDPPTTADLLQSAVLAAGNDQDPKAIELVEQALKSAPDDRDALFLLTVLASSYASEVKEPPARVALLRKSAAAFARLKSKGALSPKEANFAAKVRVDEARALAIEGKAGPALGEVLAMVASGFDDIESIEADPDFEPVRKLPEYAPSLAKAIRAGVDRELARARPFPFDFSLRDLDEKAVTLADYKGKVTLVDLWGTWCPPCREEIPTLVDLYKIYRPKGLEIVGINCNEEGSPSEVRKAIKDFAEARKIGYKCLLNDEKTEGKIPGFRGYPTAVFLDRSGKVRLQVVGAIPRVRLEAIITALLAEEPPSGK